MKNKTTKLSEGKRQRSDIYEDILYCMFNIIQYTLVNDVSDST